MNFKNQHVKDDLINHELNGLRKMVQSEDGMSRAMQAMRQPAETKRPMTLVWPLGLTSAAAGVVALAVIGSGSSSQAFASDFRAITKAQQEQKTMHEKSWMFHNGTTVERSTELWIDHAKEAFLEHTSDGSLVSASISDGIQNYRYYAGDPSHDIAPGASIDQDWNSHFDIETIQTYLTDDFFKKHSIEKQTDVLLDGRPCDYYSFAKGYYRLWVDPKTKLPVQREVYDRGVTLVERDTYEYPTQVADSTFRPIEVPGVQTCNYAEKRKELCQKLALAGMSEKVGSVTVSLKAVVVSKNLITPLWTSSSPKGDAVPARSVSCEGLQGGGQFASSLTAIPSPFAKGLQTDAEYVSYPVNLTEPLTIKIAVWDQPQSGAKPVGKIVGWAKFKVTDAIYVPNVSHLLQKPDGIVGVAVAKDSATK